MLRIDHLAVCCSALDAGVAAVEGALGVALSAGGEHAHMATHNRLLNLGDLYLEVIAPNPGVPRPAWPRWFDLDRFTGPPRLTNWVAACDDLPRELALSPAGTGVPVALSRGDFRWQMAVPADGRLPFAGAFPALIAWEGRAHPAARLPDLGLRLVRLEIMHPQAHDLRETLDARIADARLIITDGPVMAMQATFATPHGLRILN